MRSIKIFIIGLTIILLVACRQVEYEVTFESVGSVHSTLKTDGKSSIELPQTPTREGYEFEGWYLDTAHTIPLTASYFVNNPIAENITVYAKWQPIVYTVIFVTNSDEEKTPLNVQHGQSLPDVDAIERTGYRFTGWFKDAELSELVVFPMVVEGDLTLYAGWETQTFTMTFVSNGGSAISPMALSYRDAIVLPDPPTRVGHSFGGWFKDALLSEAFDALTMPAEDVTLYAAWERNSYRIDFETNEGMDIESVMIPFEAEVVLPEEPVREGYSFTGWFFDEALSIPFDLITMPAENVILYAKWEVQVYTIRFESQGGTNIEPIALNFGESIDAPLEITREGYEFEGWYLDSDYDEAFSLATMPAMDITLYAKWRLKDNTVVFESNGGSFVAPITVEDGEMVEKPTDPEREGHTFVGWFIDEELTAAYDFSTVLESSMVLYAKWQIHQFNVRFFDTLLDDIVVDYNQVIPLPPDPQIVGYTFEGWYLDEFLTTPYTNQRVVEDTILYARWRLNTYLVSWQNTEMDPLTVNHGSNIEQPLDPVRTGYTFSGWFMDAEKTTPYLFPSTITSNTTIYAGWEINRYTLSFMMNGGDAIAPLTFDYNETIVLPDTVERTGYQFINWYFDEDLTSVYNLITMPAENVVLYAAWDINSYTVSFETEGGNVIDPLHFDFDEAILLPDNPERLGYSFQGWYLDAALTLIYNLTTMPAENITLYAAWEINSYTLSFVMNGGDAIAPLTFDYNETIVLPDTVEWTGYQFINWYLDEDLTSVYNLTTMPADNVVLYAAWEINTYTMSFETEGGNVIDPLHFDFDEAILLPDDPTKTGHSFQGWYLNEALTLIYNLTTMPAENITLYAAWDINRYTVSFETDDGDFIDPISFDFGETIVLPEDPERTGYHFDQWYLDEELTIVFDVQVMPADDLVLYAGWTINQYQISFDSKGGDAVGPISFDFDADIVLPDDPTKTGHSFQGWFFDEALSMPFDLTTMPAEDFTLYALWSLNMYTVSFETNGGNLIETLSFVYGSTIFLPDNPQQEGFSFAGWYLDEALSVPYNLVTMPAENITLYANWEINEFTVSFESNGGTDIADAIVPAGQTLTAPTDPIREGHTFEGWYQDVSLTIAYDFAAEVNDSFTLYARYTVNSYDLSFETNGGNLITTQLYVYNTTITLPSNPIKEGYTFEGWYLDEDFEEAFNLLVMPASDLTLYARWTINTYVITFNTDGGTTIQSIERDFDSLLNLPADPEKSGHTFMNWYLDAQYQTVLNFQTMPANDVTLYARFELNQYAIDFVTNGGNVIPSMDVNYNTNIQLPEDPTRTGYSFLNWYLDESLTEVFDLVDMPEEDLTLYAAWQINHYTITFNSGGGSAVEPITQAFDTLVEAPEAPTRPGFTFGGWYTSADFIMLYEFTTMPAENITVFARWLAE